MIFSKGFITISGSRKSLWNTVCLMLHGEPLRVEYRAWRRSRCVCHRERLERNLDFPNDNAGHLYRDRRSQPDRGREDARSQSSEFNEKADLPALQPDRESNKKSKNPLRRLYAADDRSIKLELANRPALVLQVHKKLRCAECSLIITTI